VSRDDTQRLARHALVVWEGKPTTAVMQVQTLSVVFHVNVIRPNGSLTFSKWHTIAWLFVYMAITLSVVTKFFEGEMKLTERDENTLLSGRLISLSYDGTNGVIKATVQPSICCYGKKFSR